MKRRILQPLLLACTLLAGVALVGASLRGRPHIRQPSQVVEPYEDVGFRGALDAANEQLAELATEVDGQIAPAAENLLVARRLSLALVGSVLSLEELRALDEIPESKQLLWLTEYLLEDRRWADYFAERFSRSFVGTNDGPFLVFRRRKFNAWLSEELHAGRPFDAIVREMLSAEGLWTDTPSVNFVTATMDDADEGRGDPIRLAGRTARALLAQRIDCLQCHDDFLGHLNFPRSGKSIGGAQKDFHALAAFYAGTAFEGSPFQGIGEDGKAYRFKFLGDSEEIEVTPAVPFAIELLSAEGKPRDRLARWVTHPENRAFARAAVNRVWALLFSRPLVDPVDNIPLDNSVPPVMDSLADDFVQHGFDLRRLIRLISQTDAFRRDSRAGFEITAAHETAWAVFPITQLRPEQVSGSLFQACELKAIDAGSSIFTRLRAFGDGQDFLRRFGDRGQDEFDSEAVTITQRLVMMNGNLVTERTKSDAIGNASNRIAALVHDDKQAVDLIFWSVFNREPSPDELTCFTDHLSGKRGSERNRAVNDIYWAMINSTEFSWNH